MPRLSSWSRWTRDERGQSILVWALAGMAILFLLADGFLFGGTAFAMRQKLQGAASAAATAAAQDQTEYEAVKVTYYEQYSNTTCTNWNWTTMTCPSGDWQTVTTDGPGSTTTVKGPVAQMRDDGWQAQANCGQTASDGGFVVCDGSTNIGAPWWVPNSSPYTPEQRAQQYFDANVARIQFNGAQPTMTGVTINGDGSGWVTVTASMPAVIPLFGRFTLKVSATARPHSQTHP